ncbi:unnamed protein product [Tilletia controversa]|uniref:Uncharacterized protein n=2 Tax=Tilletia TaxID=13289 RepID=A0A177USJ2_9BASI|nr:hypothetical protein CF336_g4320 [Tilletia laevis]KAE8195782.1 hypothetical protein CF328_g4328 [Tilletia controversa]KAE8256892.1 hypothetical protein A4X03_0g4952 [Tilletia caries]KAE8200857.1 hypothetical protein CF335_g3861 [Tilletia laevis]CAD6944201.1 unnamed protein product [Tilletia caries]
MSATAAALPTGGDSNQANAAGSSAEQAAHRVLCKCTVCHRYAGAPGQLRTVKTRNNFISSDQKLFEQEMYGSGKVYDFLCDALRDNLAAVESERVASDGSLPGGRHDAEDVYLLVTSVFEHLQRKVRGVVVLGRVIMNQISLY